MDKKTPDSTLLTDASRPARGGLRLIVDNDPKPPPKEEKKQSPFVKFMHAYADAIDREVEAILDL